MVILSNVEFNKLVENQSLRLRTIAKRRMDDDPNGLIKVSDLDPIIKVCSYSGDKKAVRWLKSLKSVATSGELTRIRRNPDAWQDHVLHVATLHRNGEIAFDLFDHIMLKDTGKRGTVVDYNPDSKEFIVALNPFEVKSFPKKELEKIAAKVRKATTDEAD